MLAIKIERLTKSYPNSLAPALDNLKLEIESGSIFGILGPNGAGKSTLINIIAGLTVKTSGNLQIMGLDPSRNPINAKRMLGIVPQEIALDTFFTVKEYLEIYSGYFGLGPHERKTEQLLRKLSLWDKQNVNARALSGGMKRRLLIAKAMVHSPPILILDEPTAGVDTELREQLWSYIAELKALGTTIIITTHYLVEAEKLCDKIAFINKGKLIKVGKTTDLLEELGHKRVIATTELEINLPLPISYQHHIDGKQLIIDLPASSNWNNLLVELGNLPIKIEDIKFEATDLESIYKRIIGAAH